MKLLAVDTALGACSVAVTDGSHILAHRFEVMARGHAEALAPMVAAAMAEAGMAFADLERLAVTTGPGTFTGQRVGLAFMRGLKIALDCPLVGVTTLDAMAAAAAARSGFDAIAVLHEAKRGEVYAALYRRGKAMLPVQVAAFEAMMASIEAALDPAETLALAGTASAAAAAWLVAHGRAVVETVIAQPDALWVARLALDIPVPGEPVRPLYLRPPDAKPPKSPPGAVTCRVATPEDAQLLAALHEECLTTAWDRGSFSTALAEPTCFALIAEDHGRPIGFALGQTVAGQAELLALAVSANARRHGSGRLLVRKVAALAAETGALELFLEVASGNEPARRLYESEGFLAVGSRKGYYAGGEDALVLRAVLPLA